MIKAGIILLTIHYTRRNMMRKILMENSLRTVDEASYLTAQNVERYRAIMRILYIQHQRMKYWLKKEEIFALMKEHEIFRDYDMDSCENDLRFLTEKKNLIAVQDTSKAMTLAEFKNKRFKYKLSDISIELERLLFRLENSTGIKGSLEPKLFEKMLNHIKRINDLKFAPLDDIGQWWRDLNNDFESVNKEYTDFISALYSTNMESLMSTEGFLIYKDKLINYLNQFISQIFSYKPAIERQLLNIDKSFIEEILKKVACFEAEDPKNLLRSDMNTIEEDIGVKWENIYRWFVNDEEECEAEALIHATTEIIRKMTAYALRIIESKNIAYNRKEEYKHLAYLFSNLDLDECAKLSSVVFGVFGSRHIKGDFIKTSENPNISVLDDAQFAVKLRPRAKTYRERTKANPIKDNTSRKIKEYEDYKRLQQEEEQMLKDLIKDGRIDFGTLPTINGRVRRKLLLWLHRGLTGKKARTDTGLDFYIELPDKEKRCLITSDDGILDMPAYVIVFNTSEENDMQ